MVSNKHLDITISWQLGKSYEVSPVFGRSREKPSDREDNAGAVPLANHILTVRERVKRKEYLVISSNRVVTISLPTANTETSARSKSLRLWIMNHPWQKLQKLEFWSSGGGYLGEWTNITITERRVGRNRLATSFSVCRLLNVNTVAIGVNDNFPVVSWFICIDILTKTLVFILIQNTLHQPTSYCQEYIENHIFVYRKWHSQRMTSQARGMTKRLVSQSPRDRPWKWSRWWCCRCPVWKSPAHGRWSKPGRSCKIGWVSFWRGWSTSGAVFWYAQVFPRLHPETCCHICNNWIVGSYYIWHCASKCAFIACIHT